MRVDRRGFLQLSSLAAASGSLPALEAMAQAQPGARGSGALLPFVNPLQGTNSSVEFSRGNTLPIVALPFGMAHWTLQSRDRPGWFFEPASNRTQGFRLTHQLSPWLGDYGYATFLPVNGEPSPEPDGRASSYRPRELMLSPAYVSLFLMRYRCRMELTPTTRCALMRFTFEDAEGAGLLVDLPGDSAEASLAAGSQTVTALTHENRGGVQANFATYLVLQFDRPVRSLAVKELKDRRVAVLRFEVKAGEPVDVRVGTSFLSMDQARANLERELGSKPFDTVRHEAEQVWEKALGRVRIQGRTEREHRTFYSCLYRTLLFPRVWHEPDAAGQPVHMSPYTGRPTPGLMYADHGFWDDYHAWYPMMLLLYPERLAEILQSWCNAYREGGWIPQFPCPGYRGAMTGSPSDIIFGDAAAKGLRGFDLATAYEGLRKQGTEIHHGPGFGRTQLEPYLKLGYVPCDGGKDGVAESLDYLYGDFCVAQVARALGHEDEAKMLLARSQNWRKIFDPQVKFFRGKLASGAWVEPFDQFTWGGPYVEGGPWQYRFNLPYDPRGLMEAFGGNDAFVRELQSMFTTPPRFRVGAYGFEIHEMSEMAAADFGQYAHSNQPVHNVLYLFTLAGRRDLTQHYAHRVLSELYSPDDFAGDEDTGATSAWYILSALGLFAACPGTSKWTLGAPFFPSMEAQLGESGGALSIEAQGDGFLKTVLLNGKPTDGVEVEHRDLPNGKLVFRAT